MDHIIYRNYIANRRSFIYCSLATIDLLDMLPVALNPDLGISFYKSCGFVYTEVWPVTSTATVYETTIWPLVGVHKKKLI